MVTQQENVLDTATPMAEGSLLDEIMAQTKMAPEEEGYDVAKKGVAAFIENLLGQGHAQNNVNKQLVDQMLLEVDKKISKQMDQILHHASF
ncbi:TPA: type VI secretion system contractile sheath large subunit, partial [Vibrio parahaemolyticus]